MSKANAVLLTALLLALAGCKSEGDRAAEAYNLAEKNTTFDRDGACRQANRAKDAYLREGNEEQYESWSLTAYNACFKADHGY